MKSLCNISKKQLNKVKTNLIKPIIKLKSSNFTTVSKNINQSNPILHGINLSNIDVSKLQINDKINEFKVVNIQHFKDFNLTGLILIHELTNLRLIHLHNTSDDNNSLAYHFNTPAYDSTGIFHILEHLTLAGSSKYSERDPFFKMIKRSLKTYMNAWTGNDFTMYPFATRNIQDYENLRLVYYNSVFHPKLNYLDFLQEGWRVEPLNYTTRTETSTNGYNENSDFSNEIEKIKAELVYNGVVLNEMKGAMMNQETQFIQSTYKHLFPETSYANNSGGEPLEIPKLKYQEILNAHKKYYSFGNCSVITYGNNGVNSNSEFLSKQIELDLKSKHQAVNNIKDTNYNKDFVVYEPKKFLQPLSVIEYFQPDLSEENELMEEQNQKEINTYSFESEENKKLKKEQLEKENEKWKFAISYYTNNTSSGNKFGDTNNLSRNDQKDNVYLTFKLSVLSQLLMKGPSAPFYKNFIQKGLAPAFIHGAGYDNNLKYGVMTIGFMGFKGNNKNLTLIEKNIIDTLHETAKTGFSDNLVKEVLHLIEYDNLKPKEDFGINFYEQSVAFFTHSQEPFSVFDLPNFCNRLSKEIFVEKKKVFEELIEKYLINNNHRVHITLKPNKNLAIENNKIESNSLKLLEANLTNDDLKKIIKDNHELIEYQNSESKDEPESIKELESKDSTTQKNISNINEAKEIEDKEFLPLPTLTVDAIPQEVEDVRLAKLKTAFDIPFYFFPQQTNKLSFIRIKSNIKNLPSNFKQQIQLYTSILPKLGSIKIPYTDFQNKFNTVSSGLGISLVIDSSSKSENEFIENLVFEISFLNSNLETAMNLFTELITEPEFYDYNHINNIIKEMSVDLANNIIENSLDYAQTEAIGGLKPNYYIYNGYKQDVEVIKLGSEIITTSDPKIVVLPIIENLILAHNLIFVKENLEVSYHGDKSLVGSIEAKVGVFLNSIKNMNPIFSDSLQDNNDMLPINNQQNFTTSLLLGYDNTSKIELIEGIDNKIVTDVNNKSSELMKINDEENKGKFKVSYKKQIVKISSQVYNCVESFLVPNFNHEDYPKLIIAANLMSLNYLHKEIREKGGAYGSGARFNSGTCSFFSFRDPNPHKTYTHFEKAVIKIFKGRFTDNDLNEAKLYVFSSLDQVTAPQNKGLEMFIRNITRKERNLFRKRLLETTKEEVISVSKKYFVEQLERGITSRVIFGNVNEEPQNEIDEYFANENWDIINSMSFLSEEHFEEKDI